MILLNEKEKASVLGHLDSADTAAVEGIFQTINTVIAKSSDIMVELLRAGATNPFVGAVSSMIIADVLEKANVIYPTTNSTIKLAALVYLGVDISTQVIGAITTLIDAVDPIDAFKGFVSSGNASQNPLSLPTSVTNVYAIEPNALQALLGRAKQVN